MTKLLDKVIVGILALFIIGVLVLSYINYEPIEPEETLFPITNAVALAQFQAEYIDIDFPCEGVETDENGIVVLKYEWMSSLEYNSEINEYGYYGSAMQTNTGEEILLTGFAHFAECRTIEEWYDAEQTQPKSGHVYYSYMFDPNNGFTYQLTCNYPKFPDVCPKDENGDFVWIGFGNLEGNPDYETYIALEIIPSVNAGLQPLDAGTEVFY